MIEYEFKVQALRTTNDRDLINELWQEISSAYSQPERHYHNLTHLESVLTELSAVKSKLLDWPVIVFSIVYHDLVYDTERHDNEEQSSAIAIDRLTKLNFPQMQLGRCRDQILSTKGHNLSADSDTNYFTDADLSILGESSNKYKVYSEQIRQEYSRYGDEIYKPGRIKVLEHFLNLKDIYKTRYFRDRYESQARENIANEILRLT